MLININTICTSDPGTPRSMSADGKDNLHNANILFAMRKTALILEVCMELLKHNRQNDRLRNTKTWEFEQLLFAIALKK